MKIIKEVLIGLLFISVTLIADESKTVKKTFDVSEGNTIKLETVSGMDVEIIVWDKNQISIDLEIEISSSDRDFEREYIQKFDISMREFGDETIVRINEFDDDPDWSFWDLFKLRFNYRVEKDIRGRIFVPADSPLISDFAYGNVSIDGIKNELTLLGKGNELIFSNCASVQKVENNYGEIKLTNCGGNLDLESQSSTIEINSFEGAAVIVARYSEIRINNVSGDVNIESQSANVEVDNVTGNLIIDSKYSEIEASFIDGMIDVESQSAIIKIKNAGGVIIDSPYSDVFIRNISGKSSNEMKIKNQSGTIDISSAAGNLIIDDSYSSVSLKTIEGNIKLLTKSSNIYAGDIKGDWYSDTQYSEYHLENFESKNIKIDNSSGAVRLDLKTLPELIDIKNRYGNVSLKLPADYTAQVELTAHYGEINSDFPLLLKSKSSDTYASGQIGVNPTRQLKIETSSGSIFLNKK
ncbi:MAG: DUF4097 domain-containing protein [Melioribacteraceae bacterium]|nr:DUF4097 domain-containing protein [Melioribacteraceae bacterium]MCF8355324.1 DUF4097 domain-containing protein [Melioribacteraceae bacterium]MCF8396333.1 DUF4097 domain-containing protein [Melioribacteraceae bacterium]MCF8420402.1 DUF4097 domain-containing protein [Melioribacteraceae bacterium]